MMQRFVLWLARKVGLQIVARPRPELIDSAKEFAKHVEKQSEPWEWKHRQCIRAMINRFPKEKIRNLNLAIEIAVQECSES